MYLHSNVNRTTYFAVCEDTFKSSLQITIVPNYTAHIKVLVNHVNAGFRI